MSHADIGKDSSELAIIAKFMADMIAIKPDNLDTLATPIMRAKELLSFLDQNRIGQQNNPLESQKTTNNSTESPENFSDLSTNPLSNNVSLANDHNVIIPHTGQPVPADFLNTLGPELRTSDKTSSTTLSAEDVIKTYIDSKNFNHCRLKISFENQSEFLSVLNDAKIKLIEILKKDFSKIAKIYSFDESQLDLYFDLDYHYNSENAQKNPYKWIFNDSTTYYSHEIYYLSKLHLILSETDPQADKFEVLYRECCDSITHLYNNFRNNFQNIKLSDYSIFHLIGHLLLLFKHETYSCWPKESSPKWWKKNINPDELFDSVKKNSSFFAKAPETKQYLGIEALGANFKSVFYLYPGLYKDSHPRINPGFKFE